MPPRRNKVKFQIMEFERGRIISLRVGGFFYHAIGARVQIKTSTVIRIWKQGTDEHRATRKTGSRRLKVASARDVRHLRFMAVNNRSASSRQLAVRWSTATCVLMLASSIRRRLLHQCIASKGRFHTRSPSRQNIGGCVCKRALEH
ncbi:uncharacterized protein TNCV_4785681 [Trichonephila clavipes]|nr:uncharacterized protein TNCV_4785681 [Trichonephila clavipes]